MGSDEHGPGEHVGRPELECDHVNSGVLACVSELYRNEGLAENTTVIILRFITKVCPFSLKHDISSIIHSQFVTTYVGSVKYDFMRCVDITTSVE